MTQSWGIQRTPTVGVELKRLRVSHGWTLRTLGKKSNLDYSYLSRIEKAERRASPGVVETLDAVLEANGRLIDVWATENDVARPAQLPVAPIRFVGREAQLAELSDVLSRQSEKSPAVITIDGPAGVGKTALALRCAHDHSRQFFHGQLYCDLGGFAASRTEVTDPSTILKWFCIALGAEPAAIPTAVTERAALYRSLLADRRVLVVLDNAADSRQVEHLLPGTRRCAVIVTSRRVLSGLTALTDAHRVPVGPLRESDSIMLMGQLIGIERAERDRPAVLALTRFCGHLPLALRITAERVVACPESPIQTHVRDLSTLHRRLDYFETGDLAGVRSVVSWSYGQLSTGAARVFRLLSVDGGLTVATEAAAAFVGGDLNSTYRHLRELDQLHLVDLGSDDVVRLDELLRAYAVERMQAEDNPAERATALDRVIHWYIQAMRANLDTASIDTTGPRMSTNQSVQPEQHEHGLRDVVRVATAALENGFSGGTWQCATALWNRLLNEHGDGIPCGTYQGVLDTVSSQPLSLPEHHGSTVVTPTIPQQRPHTFGDQAYGQANLRRSAMDDQHGLVWSLIGAALLAVIRKEDSLAREFSSQANELLDVIGESDSDVGTLRLASAFLRMDPSPVPSGVTTVEAARFVTETAAERRVVDHPAQFGTPEDKLRRQTNSDTGCTTAGTVFTTPQD